MRRSASAENLYIFYYDGVSELTVAISGNKPVSSAGRSPLAAKEFMTTDTTASAMENEREKTAIPWGDIALICLVTFLVYFSSLGNGFVNFDDKAYILENPLVQKLSLANLATIWTSLDTKPYYPVVFTVYSLGYSLWGANPTGFHSLSLALHLLNIGLVYVLVLKLFRKRAVAVIVGLLVGLHPLHTDTVCWASDLKNILSATFVYLSLLAYVGYIHREAKGLYYLSLFLYVFALLSKTMAALLPFMLLIVDYQQRRHDRRLEIVEKIPFLVVAVVLGFITFKAQSAVVLTPPEATTSFYSASNAFMAIGFYLAKLLFPTKLSVLYSSTYPMWVLVIGTLVSLMFISMTVWMLMLSRDYGFGLAWFVLLAFPMLGFIPFGYVKWIAPFSNHFMYLADIGLFVCVGLLYCDIWKDLHSRSNKAVLLVLVAVAFSLFSLKTMLRSGVWENSETLWRDAVRYNSSPNSVIGHTNLASAYRDAGKIGLARDHVARALEIVPQYQPAKRLLEELQEEHSTQ